MAINVKTISQLDRAEQIKDADLFEVSIKSGDDKYISKSISCVTIIDTISKRVELAVSADYTTKIDKVDGKVEGLRGVVNNEGAFKISPYLANRLSSRVLSSDNYFPTVAEVRDQIVGQSTIYAGSNSYINKNFIGNGYDYEFSVVFRNSNQR